MIALPTVGYGWQQVSMVVPVRRAAKFGSVRARSPVTSFGRAAIWLTGNTRLRLAANRDSTIHA